MTLSFVPCVQGDNGINGSHCGGSAIPQLPEWGRFTSTFITMPSARFLRIRTWVGGWGAGQYWVDDFRVERVDGALKNVIRPPALTDLVVEAGGARYEEGRDYTMEEPPTAIDAGGNFSALQGLVVRRAAGSRIAPRAAVNMSYDIVPGNANRMVGGRDVSCYVEPRLYQLMEPMVNYTMKTLRPRYLMANGFDEQMGMGRDSRTLLSGLTNGEILAYAMNRTQAMITAVDPEATLVTWADMVVRAHNGGANYSWFGGAGRRQPYWTAMESIDRRIVLLSWIYDTGDYARRLIESDPDYFQTYGTPWLGCPWTDLENVRLWGDAVQRSRNEYGARSTSRGMLCTNWGGGRFEAGLVPTARRAWNLDDH